MTYCGLDVALRSSYIFVTREDGSKLSAGEVATEKTALAERLGAYVAGGLAVVLEAGNQSAWIHDALVELGARVTVVHPARVKLIAESRRKTDKIDAKILCELLRVGGLPEPVHVPPAATRALRGLLQSRRQLVATRIKLALVVRGLLRQEGLRLEPGALKSEAGWQRVLGLAFPQPHLPLILSAYFISFQAIQASLRQIDRELAATEKHDARTARLKTIPKVGRIASLTFLAAADDVRRFASSRKLISYAGLAPTVRSSGERTQYGSITRQGRAELRTVWVQIAHLVAADTHRSTARLRKWFTRVAYHRGKRTAIVALARKLLTIAYRIVFDEAVYNPTRIGRAA